MMTLTSIQQQISKTAYNTFKTSTGPTHKNQGH